MGETLAGRVAIVTGGSKGIGFGIAESLAAEGARVVLAARTAVVLQEAVNRLRDQGRQAEAFAADLRDPDAPAALVAHTMATAGHLDIVVNNAGATKRGPFLDLTDADFADGFALKYFGAVRLCRAAWPHLRETRGSIVFIAGVGGRTPGPLFAVGGSVNAALLSLAKSLAETGREDGIQVNAVNPGAIRTDRLKTRLAALAAEYGGDQRAAEAAFVTSERVTRVGEPVDIGTLVTFLVGPGGRFLHGALIDADGGATKTI